MYRFPLEPKERILKKGMSTIQAEDKAGIGALYLTTERLVFTGYAGTSISSRFWVEVPLVHIREITPAKTFELIDNVIIIDTIRQQRVRIIVRDRDRWLAQIVRQTDLL
ncbi:MAG: GRAM domain-containing protein [Negativicutes bacterium]|nr:GRAM domain-containing protein [Negativicutes bacterium]